MQYDTYSKFWDTLPIEHSVFKILFSLKCGA